MFAHNHKARHSDGKESHVDTSFIYDGKIRGEFSKVKTLFVTDKHSCDIYLLLLPSLKTIHAIKREYIENLGIKKGCNVENRQERHCLIFLFVLCD